MKRDDLMTKEISLCKRMCVYSYVCICTAKKEDERKKVA